MRYMTTKPIAEVRFRLADVDCTSSVCTVPLARHLGTAPGVVDYYANPMDSILTIRFDPRTTTVEEITKTLRASGLRTIGPIMGRRR